MTERESQGGRAGVELQGDTLRCSGPWTVRRLGDVAASLGRLVRDAQGALAIDLGAVERMDTGGAWLLVRTVADLEAQGRRVSLRGLSGETGRLYELVREVSAAGAPPAGPQEPGALESLGRQSLGALSDSVDFATFLGEVALRAIRLLGHPRKLRWREILNELAQAGHKALPILGLLSFLLGVVIAYQGGVQLRQYGATIFIADLVGLSMLREFAPLMTAIIVAGRTGSAYAAEIGTMKVTEEIDALRSIGISPIDMLVLPKLVALVVAMPLLTVYADITGVLGGMVMAGAQLHISFGTFIDRLGQALTLESYMVGVGKAPVFAAIVAAVGCFQGLQVSGSAASVGRRTTVSVVHSIIAVIVVDAAFSVAFNWLGI